MIPTLRQSGGRRRRARGYNLPFAVDNLLALDAAVRDSLTTAGGAVSLWEDIGPSGRNFAAGVTPDHDDTDDIVNFNGSDDYLENGTGLLPTTGDFTIVSRFKFTGGRMNTVISSFDSLSGSPANFAIDVISTNVLRFYGGTASGLPIMTLTTGTAINTVGLRTATVTRSGHTFTIRVDGVQLVSHTDTGSNLRQFSASFVRLGARYTQRYLLGGIVRVGCWGQAFTGGDLTTIEDWASNGG